MTEKIHQMTAFEDIEITAQELHIFVTGAYAALCKQSDMEYLLNSICGQCNDLIEKIGFYSAQKRRRGENL